MGRADDERDAEFERMVAQAKKMKPAERKRFFLERDWTIHPRTMQSNSSPEFERLVKEVGALIRGSAHDLINGRSDAAARLIMAQLAHVYGLKPPSHL